MSQVREASEDPLILVCRSLPGTTEDVKWGDDLVFSVADKMFAGFLLPELEVLFFKVEPPLFATLVRKRGTDPSPYLGRYHWVRVERGTSLSEERLKELIRESHALVAAKLSRRVRLELGIAET